MSFTQANTVFAAIHESGFNDLLIAFLKARPHYLTIGTQPFVATTSALWTQVAPVGGLDFRIEVAKTPTVDITPAASTTLLLPPGPGRFTLKAEVRLTHLASTQDLTHTNLVPFGIPIPLTFYGLCVPTVANWGPGTGEIGIALEDLAIDTVNPILQPYVTGTILPAVLPALQTFFANQKLPFGTFNLGWFSLVLQAGPDAVTDQLLVRGSVL